MVELSENVLLARGASNDAVIPPLTMPLCLHLNGDSHAVYRLFTKSKEQTERREKCCSQQSKSALCLGSLFSPLNPHLHHSNNSLCEKIIT